MVFCEIKVFIAIVLTIGIKVLTLRAGTSKHFRKVINYLAFVPALPYCQKECIDIIAKFNISMAQT